MQSNHSQNGQTAEIVNWLERAKLHAGSDIRAVGSGRFMLTTVDDAKRCFLFETKAEAEAMIAQPSRCKITDLAGKTAWQRMEEAPEVYDADELRRERRARRAALAATVT
jgi:hypothetical protein